MLGSFLNDVQLTTKNLKKAILYGIITAIAILLISTIIGMIIVTTQPIATDTDISNANQIIRSYPNYTSLLFLLIITSIVEEIFFRGFLLAKIKKHTKEITAIISTALIFALMHIIYLQIYTIILAFITGIIFAYLVIKTQNLFSSITAHTTYNLIIFSIMYFLI